MKKMYINPTVEIIEVAVEAGIASSGGLIPPSPGESSAGGLDQMEEI